MEGVGALLLFTFWLVRFPPGEALRHAVFQSASPFCDTGFSTVSDSLTGFGGSRGTLMMIVALIFLGGSWFPDRGGDPDNPCPKKAGRTAPLSLLFPLALVTTAVLVVGRAAVCVFLEWHGILAGFSPARWWPWTGIRLGRRISNQLLLNCIPLGSGFSLQVVAVSYGWVGYTLREPELPRRNGIILAALHDILRDEMVSRPDPDALLKESDTFLVAGTDEAIMRAGTMETS